MINIIAIATSDEQSSSAIIDLKNRKLIKEGSYFTPQNNDLIDGGIGTALSKESEKTIEKFRKEGKYVVFLVSKEDAYFTIKELAEGLHGLEQMTKL